MYFAPSDAALTSGLTFRRTCASATAMVELKTLGSSQLITSRTTITPTQAIVFSAGLYLVVERGKPHNRSRLASLFWPTASVNLQTHRLRQTIYQLRSLG